MVVLSLSTTMGLSSDHMTVLDAFRRKQHLSHYMGEDIDDLSADICICEVEQLLGEVTAWLKKNRPDLLRRRFSGAHKDAGGLLLLPCERGYYSHRLGTMVCSPGSRLLMNSPTTKPRAGRYWGPRSARRDFPGWHRLRPIQRPMRLIRP